MPAAVGELTATDPQEPLAGQLSVVGDTVLPPVTLSVSDVAVWPELLKLTVPEAAVGVVVVTVSGLGVGVAAMLGAVNPGLTTSVVVTVGTLPPADEVIESVPL